MPLLSWLEKQAMRNLEVTVETERLSEASHHQRYGSIHQSLTATALNTTAGETHGTRTMTVRTTRTQYINTIVSLLETRLRQAACSQLGADCTAAQLREKHIAVSNERQGLLDQGVQPASFDSYTRTQTN